MPRITINAANLHAGGVVQVASSFLTELVNEGLETEISRIFVSSEVARNLAPSVLASRSDKFKVIDSFGIRGCGVNDKIISRHAETVFTIFGPFYNFRRSSRNIVGFGQAWIIYPRNECYAGMSLLELWKTRLKYWIQGYFFRRADVLIVELDHVRDGLIHELGIPPERIRVVRNCLSSIYHDEGLWQDVTVPQVACDLRLGFLGRNYRHKNTAIFSKVAAVLAQSHGIVARFHVTFTDAEWRACSPEFRAVCINVGPLTVAQCPSFYRQIDAVVFPSLLECFSVAPLEAMAMERPLFASDRPFNRDICGEHAYYFDPLDAESIAARIAEVLSGHRSDGEALRAARNHAMNFSSPAERAEKYLAILTEDLSTTTKE